MYNIVVVLAVALVKVIHLGYLYNCLQQNIFKLKKKQF